MPNREVIHEINSEQEDLARTGVSPASISATITVAGDDLAPAAPSGETAAQIPNGIRIEWTNPTLNADGTTCVDQRWAKVYYKSTTGVTKAVYDGTYVIAATAGSNSAFDDSVTTGTARYYIITAIDGNSNESDASGEVDSTGGGTGTLTEIPDDASGLVFDDTVGTEGVVVGDGILGVAFQQPAATWSGFDHFRLYYSVDTGGGFGAWTEITPTNRIGYIHKGLNTGHDYRYKATIVAADGTESSTPDKAKSDDSGYTPNGSDNSLIVAELVFAENIVATNEVRGEHFFAESYLAINSDTWQQDGIQLEYNAGNPRAYIGDGSNEYLMFDGTYLTWNTANTVMDSGGNLTVNAKISILNDTWQNQGVQFDYNSGTPRMYVGDGGVTSSDRYIMFDGTNLSWQGVNTSLTAAGAFTATNATITGSITITGGSLVGLPGWNQNVLYDPGMEQGSAHWGTNGVRQTSGGNDSNNWWKITRTGSNLTDYNRDFDGGILYIEVNEGEVWEFGADIQSDGTCDGQALVYTRDADKAGVGAVATASYTTAAWATKSNTVTIAAGVKFLIFSIAALTDDGWTGFDNCFLRQVNFDNGRLGGANVVTISSAGLNVGTSGSIMGGQTAYDTGTGFFMGYSAAAYKFSIGNAAGNKLTWDGSTLAITGTITAGAGTIGGFTINATEGLYAGAAATRVQMKAGAGFWCGATAQGSAPFRVTAAGALTATSATITGTLTCGAGSSWGGNAIDGDTYITCTNLAAINADIGEITAGTLNGAEIRTASSGARAVMSSTGVWGVAHQFECYDATRLRSSYAAGGLAHYESDGDLGCALNTGLGYGILDLRDQNGAMQVYLTAENDSTPATDYIAFFRNDTSDCARPVLVLDQDDVSEGFINFVGSDRGVIDEGVSSVESVRVEVNGVVRRLAVYADA